MTFTEIKDAVQDGKRIEGKAHEELLWYQLREIDAARRQLLPPDKIIERERKVKAAFVQNTRHEEVAAMAISKLALLRIEAEGAADGYMKERTIENADGLIRCFYNLPRFGEDDTSSTASGPPSPAGKATGGASPSPTE